MHFQSYNSLILAVPIFAYLRPNRSIYVSRTLALLMELSDLEKTVLDVFEDEGTMTLKMVSENLEEPSSLSRQRV